MKNVVLSLFLIAGLSATTSYAAPQPRTDAVEYVKICSFYGSGFYYIPGTDICLNSQTDDARQQTVGGTWRTRLPYAEGNWTTHLDSDCKRGHVVHVGTFHSTDFTLNDYDRKQTAPFSLALASNFFISKVYWSGGFYDPRIPARSGTNGILGLCLRSIDPTLMEAYDPDPINPPYGTGNLPISCVANSRITGMPAAYALNAQAAYPSIDTFFPTDDQTVVSGPYLYGKQLVVTTDVGAGGPTTLEYGDTTSGTTVPTPLAGTLSVSVCVEKGLLDTATIHELPAPSPIE